MKTVYLIDSSKYGYHKGILADFTDIVPGEVYDLAFDENEIMYNDIAGSGADVIITFDTSGFSYRTVMDALSFNNIYARFAHILFHKPDYYKSTIKDRQNLSMFMYIPNGEDVSACETLCPDVPNIREFGPFRYKASTEEEHEINKDTVRKWWEEFKKEAML